MSSSKNKKERRQARYERNVKKEKEYKAKAWEEGKLLKPNHNNGEFPGDYCIELGKRLYERIQGRLAVSLQPGENNQDLSPNDRFIYGFRLYRIKIRDFILHYNTGIDKTPEYLYLKSLIEVYWDEPESLLKFAQENTL